MATKKQEQTQDEPATTSPLADDPSLSTQAHFSTYTENTDLPETNPPTGRHVVQELGHPEEGPVEPFGG